LSLPPGGASNQPAAIKSSRSLSQDTAATPWEGYTATSEDDDEDDREEACMFAFQKPGDASLEEEEEIDSCTLRLELVGLGDDEDCAYDILDSAGALLAPGIGASLAEENSENLMGASPVLLSALERVAAGARTQAVGNGRARDEYVQVLTPSALRNEDIRASSPRRWI